MFTAATRLLLENLSRWQLPIFRLAIPGTVLLRVFLLPKVSADAVTAGAQVYLKDGKITIEETDAVAAGIAWEDAGANTTVVEVKINA
jgi:hypothetical protein